jgi:hypothetical protein
MYLHVITSRQQTEHELHHVYNASILNIGDQVLNNVNFGLTRNIDRFEFVRAKILSRFDNNLSLTHILFKPKVIKKLISTPAPLEQQDIVNNITNEINNYYPDSGELIEDQW